MTDKAQDDEPMAVEEPDQITESTIESLSTIFHNGADGVSVVDRNLVILGVNNTLDDWFATTDPLVGLKCHQVFHDRDDPCDECPAIRAMETGHWQSKRVRMTDQNGQPAWIELIATPLVDSDNRIVGVMEQLRDISRYLEIEDKINHRRAYFESLIQQLPEALAILDDNRRIVSINHEFTELFGYEGNEVAGRLLADLIGFDEVAGQIEKLRDVLRQGGRIDVESKCRLKDGRIIDVSILSAPLMVDDHDQIYFAIYRDITNRKMAEMKLAESKKRYLALFANAPIALLEEDLSKVKIRLDELANQGVKDLNHYLVNNPDELINLIDLSRTIDVNEAAMRMYDARTKQEFLHKTDSIVEMSALDMFRSEFVQMWHGNDVLESDGKETTLHGKSLHIHVRKTVAPGSEFDWKQVFVSITDLTEQRRIQKEEEKRARFQGVMEMAGAACHELNQPLQIITGLAELLMSQEKTNSSTLSKAERMLQAAERLASITKKINSLTKYQTTDYVGDAKIIDIHAPDRD